MKKLPENIFSKINSLEKELAPLKNSLVNRVEYILKKIGEICGSSFKYWYVDGAGEGELGDINKIFYRDYIERGYIICGDVKENVNCDFNVLLEKEDANWDLATTIPRRWLHEDFEKELSNGKARYKEQKNLDVKKVEARKQAKKSFIDSAKKKLSKEEIKALGL